MAKRPKGPPKGTPPKGTKPRRPTALPREYASVSSIPVRPPVTAPPQAMREKQKGKKPGPRPNPPLPKIVSNEATGNEPALLDQSFGEPVAVAPDLSLADAQALVKKLQAFAAEIQTEYSSHHVMFDDADALAEVANKGRERILSHRDELFRRVDPLAGPNVDKVEGAWTEALLKVLGPIELEVDDWRAEKQYLVPLWRERFSSTPEGETLAVSYHLVAPYTLRPSMAAKALEETVLPTAIRTVLGLVDWDLKPDLPPYEPTQDDRALLKEHRDALRRSLEAVPAGQRKHYIHAYHRALAAVVGDNVSPRADRKALTKSALKRYCVG